MAVAERGQTRSRSCGGGDFDEANLATAELELPLQSDDGAEAAPRVRAQSRLRSDGPATGHADRGSRPPGRPREHHRSRRIGRVDRCAHRRRMICRNHGAARRKRVEVRRRVLVERADAGVADTGTSVYLCVRNHRVRFAVASAVFPDTDGVAVQRSLPDTPIPCNRRTLGLVCWLERSLAASVRESGHAPNQS